MTPWTNTIIGVILAMAVIIVTAVFMVIRSPVSTPHPIPSPSISKVSQEVRPL